MRQRFDSSTALAPVFVVVCFILFTTMYLPLGHAAKPTNETILVQDNAAFSIDLYQELRESGDDMLFSPYSISTALAMTYAGARGNTAKEMAATLRFSLDQGSLHAAFAEIRAKLNKLQEAGNVTLHVANSLWPQQGYEFLEEYLLLVEEHYGASITPVDYEGAGEVARLTINDWVQENTQGKIQEIFPPGVLDALTRLVLVNAIYFKGNWESQFKASETEDVSFYLSVSDSIQTPTMTQKQTFWYADYETLQVIELPYAGNGLSMFILLPRDVDGLPELEDNLTAESLKGWRHQLRLEEVRVFLPRFKMTSKFDLSDVLVSMGMADAFGSAADFSGMDGRTEGLYVSAVLHKAFIEVNEKGTEAAAATGIAMLRETVSLETPPFLVFRADHPFVYVIQDNATGSILFLGKLQDPTSAGG